VHGAGFLRHMVRAIAKALLDVAYVSSLCLSL
jgi:tRNA U38,U39,U40 pseudouridine synthase TruA